MSRPTTTSRTAQREQPPFAPAALSVRDTLFILSLDLRTDWHEPEDPRQVAAWRAWWAMERAEREILPAIRAIGRAVPPALSVLDATDA